MDEERGGVRRNEEREKEERKGRVNQDGVRTRYGGDRGWGKLRKEVGMMKQ